MLTDKETLYRGDASPFGTRSQRGPSIRVQRLPSPLGPITVSYTSRWLTRSNNIRMPGQLWVEATGFGADFETTVYVLANAALAGLPIMSVAAMRPSKIRIGDRF